MQVRDAFVHFLQLVAGAIFLVLAAAGAAGLYFFRFQRRKVKEKHIDYSNFKRVDSLDYVRFDDVAENMVVTDGGRRFVGGISCGGCDYRDAESGERLQVIRGYLSFLNVLDSQYIQFWQMARDVNLDRMVSDYKKQLSRLQEQHYLLSLDYEELRKESEKVPETEPEEYDQCYGVQPEAFLSGMPLNKRVDAGIGPVRTAGLKRHTMDKLSLCSIFNHAQTDFIHENGVILGRNMSNWKPVAYDCYDASHNGYNVVFCGMTGTGKSATMKILASRYISKNGYRFVAIDSQARGSRGEYSMMADVQCGVNYQVSVGSPVILNPFEVCEEEEWSERDGDYLVLKLKDKIEDAKGSIMIMVQGSRGTAGFELATYLERIITDIIIELYDDLGIVDGQVDSLFEDTAVGEHMFLSAGRKKRKPMPTLTGFYKKALVKERENRIAEHKKAYRVLLDSLKERVKELYYCPGCLAFYTREQYEAGSVCPCQKAGGRISRIQGVKSYFDGQSNVAIDRNVKFTNIDLSQQPEEERAVARLIALSFVTEHFIKRNAVNPKKTEYLGVICDELHENFKSLPAVQKLDYVSRTSRKRLVSLWTATQALKDYQRMPETEALLKQAATKFVFKQDYQDRAWVKEALNVTNGQADRIMELGGDPSDADSDRKGEVCIVDNGKVCFCKVDYLKSAEAVFVETDARILQAMYGKGAR